MLNDDLNIWSPRPNVFNESDNELLEKINLQMGVRELSLAPLEVWHYPVMRIESLPVTTTQLSILENISSNALCLFMSQNAVKTAVHQIHRKISPDWFMNQSVLAIGPQTHQTLLEDNINPVDKLEGPFTSEGLLASKILSSHLSGAKNILIFSGEGGRSHLFNTLSQRYQKIMKIESYRRIKIYIHQSDMLKFLQIRKINAVFLTSCEVVDLVVMQLKRSGVLNHFLNQVMFCISPRVAEYAKDQGFMQVVVAEQADIRSLIKAAILRCKNYE